MVDTSKFQAKGKQIICHKVVSWINICGNHECENTKWRKGTETGRVRGPWNHKNDFYFEAENNSNAENSLGWVRSWQCDSSTRDWICPGERSNTQNRLSIYKLSKSPPHLHDTNQWIPIDTGLDCFSAFRFRNDIVNIFESEGASAVKILVSTSLFDISGIDSITGKVENICESFALKNPQRTRVSYPRHSLYFGLDTSLSWLCCTL